MKRALQKTKSESTPGPDGIPYGLLKKLPSVQHVLATLFNRILESGEVPPTWQEGVIVLIHKSGDPNDPSNYRPIALTSTIAKTFHSILAKRILQFVTDNNIIDKTTQKGFLHNVMGCPEHSIVLQNTLRHARRTKHALHCIWLDFKKCLWVREA